MDIKIIFEDKNLLAIEKSSGLVVHNDGRTEEGSLVDWVEENYPQLKSVGNPHTLDSGRYTKRWGIVNRLDRETSGLILIGKDEDAFLNLQKQFIDRTITKEYVAVVHGKVAGQKFKITEGITRHKKDPRIWVCASDEGARQSVRSAETDIEVIKSGQEYSILKLLPKTGRTHQLRLHCKFIGHPILGDKKYSFGGIDNVSEVDRNTRLMLHAKKLTIKHPSTQQVLNIETDLPEIFSAF